MVLVLLLTLHYARSMTNVCDEAAYGSVARVTCPAGSIITEVLYAAFSTAITGSCATGSPYKGVAINLGYNCDTAVNAFGMVQGACLYHNSCSLLASRSEFSFQGAPKDCSSSAPRLAINVTCSPRAFPVPLPAVVTICGSARDSSSMRLSCQPQGGDANYVISNITFASYGRPLGQCFSAGNPFRTYGCNSINSMAMVQAACLNRASCVVPVSPSYFSATSSLSNSVSSYCQSNDPLRWLFVSAQCSRPVGPANEGFFYIATRSASAVVRSPVPNTLISAIKIFAFGEPVGHFVPPVDNMTALPPPAFATFAAASNQCDCVAPSVSSNKQTCAAAASDLAKIESRCLYKHNCTLPNDGTFFQLDQNNQPSCLSYKYSMRAPALYLQGQWFGCPVGSVFTKQASLSCSPCGAGTYAPGVGGRVCLDTPLGAQPTASMSSGGAYVPLGAGGFASCTGGSIRPSLVASPSCTLCPSGAVSQPFPFPTQCKACDAGSVPDAAGLACESCGVGLYAQSGDASCQASPVGAFPSAGMGSALLATVSASGFSLCPPGSFNAQAGSLTCSLCGEGTFAATPGAAQCSLAQAGAFVSGVGGTAVELCPVGSFSRPGASACLSCSFPLTNSLPGSAACPNVCLSVSVDGLAAVFTIMLFIFAACIASTGPLLSIKIFFNVAFPALDVFSDLAYLLSVTFANYAIFGLSVVAYSYGVPYFAAYLVEVGAGPRWLLWPLDDAKWLGFSRSNDPIYFATFQGRRILSLDSHSNLALVLLEVVVWVVAGAAQVVCLCLWPFVTAVNLLFVALWFALGAYLHMAKVLSIGGVWNAWVWVWRGGRRDEFQTSVAFDTNEHNTSLKNEFFFETAPQILLQTTNNFVMNSWSSVEIFSSATSIVMAVNGIYRLLYFTVLIDKPIPLYKVPTGNLFRIESVNLTLDTRMPSTKKEFYAMGRPTTVGGVGAGVGTGGGTGSPMHDDPASLAEAVRRFFHKYMPLEGSQTPQEQEQYVDCMLSDDRYKGCGEEVIADVCHGLYGTHPSELGGSAATTSDEARLAPRKMSTFEMDNPFALATARGSNANARMLRLQPFSHTQSHSALHTNPSASL